jgi:hypothetical protein
MTAEYLDDAFLLPFTSGGAIAVGQAVAFSGATVVAATAVTTDSIGIAVDVATSTGAEVIRVALLGHGVVKGLVGTGGGTVGAWAVAGTAGCTDVNLTTVTGKVVVLGQWVENATYSAGDLRLLNLGPAGAHRAPAA